MKSSNPALRNNTFTQFGTREQGMTIGGTSLKALVLIALLIVSGAYSWSQRIGLEQPFWMIPMTIGNMIVAFALIFRPQWSPFLAPVYAIAEGLLLGTISSFLEQIYPGIVLQAVLGTVGVFLGMLVAYQTGLVRATEKLRLGVMAATMGLAFVYLVDFALSFFGHQVPFIHETGPVGIGFSLVVIVIAAMNLTLDFDFIERGAERGAPKYMEWYGGFALVLTLVWLYLEILNLLAKMNKK